MRRGFTLIELASVLAIIGIVSALAVPSYTSMVRRARAAEARSMLEAIAHAELQYHRDQGEYLACAPAGEVPQGPGVFPSEEPCWKALGLRLDGEVRYRYQVRLGDGTFTALAEGDLDKDGVTSAFTLNGKDLSIEVRDETE